MYVHPVVEDIDNPGQLISVQTILNKHEEGVKRISMLGHSKDYSQVHHAQLNNVIFTMHAWHACVVLLLATFDESIVHIALVAVR